MENTSDIRSKVLLSLSGELSPEQLKAVDMAVARAMHGYRVEPEQTLPQAYNGGLPPEAKEFLVRKHLKGCSEGTLEQYGTLLADYCQWLNKDVKDATDLDIVTYLEYKGANGVSRRSMDNKRRILNIFYTFLHDTGRVRVNPCKSVDPIKFKSAPRVPLTDIELERVRNACTTPREKALFEVFYSTGCRVSEVVGMNHTAIDLQTRSCMVTGKGDKDRQVFFNAKALVAIDEYLRTRDDDNPALFVSERKPHGRIKKPMMEHIMHDLGTRSGIGRRVFPHLLRHTFATDMLCRGARIDEVSFMLGHSDVGTTQIYAKTSAASVAHTHRVLMA